MYCDNILVYFRTEEKYIQHMIKVLRVLQKADLRVKSEKSQFHIKKVQFLEFIVISEELQINFVKVQSVIKWLTSISVKKVQVILKFINFYRKFVKKYLKIVASLTELTKKNTKFEWFKKAQKVFNELKKKFTS